MSRRVSLLFPVLGLCIGCVDTSTDRVTLRASIDDAELTIEKRTLVTVLGGTFDVVIELGDLADESRTVERASAFSLVRASDRSLVRNLDAALAAGPDFFVTIEPDEAVRLSFELTDENTIPSEDFESVCEGGDLVIAGGLEEADGTDVPVDSGPVLLEGCP